MRGAAAGGTEAASVVRELELQYYETQLELHDCRFEILRNEELLLLLTQIKSTQRQIRGVLSHTHTHTHAHTYAHTRTHSLIHTHTHTHSDMH